ncbi:MAG: Sua5/YciO/YrdC/YwlC family protein [Saprospiraceae bacterium]|nr:Sua5/YciO/YrdC/YwlC family protein [Saprospiraceae bacterium]
MVTSGSPYVVRIPSHPITLALLESAGFSSCCSQVPILWHISPTTAQHVADQQAKIYYILDGGPCDVGVESNDCGT